MKNFLLLLALPFIFSFSANSQSMDPGTGFLSIGIGPSSSYNTYSTNTTPAFRLSFDKGFKQIGPGTLSFGGMIGGFSRSYNSNYYDHKYLNTYHYKWSWTYFVAAMRVGYYYNLGDLDVKEMNVYGGLSVGPRFAFLNEQYDGPADGAHPEYSSSSFGFHFGSFLGANYFLTEKIALYTEFGYDISWFTMGVTLNM